MQSVRSVKIKGMGGVMLEAYKDIKSRIDEAPKWYDEQGVPRYDDFHPSMANNFYAKEAILLQIACQNCHQKFKACLTQRTLQIHKLGSFENKLDTLHYGDPPRHRIILEKL